MKHSATTVLKDLAEGKYAPLYFLQGEEVYYIDAITNYIESNLLTPAERSFNLTVLYGKESSMATLLTQARRFPLGASKQIVILKEAQEMADFKSRVGQELLLHYLQRPQTTTLLIFAYKYKTLDGRTALAKALAEKTVLVTSKKLYDPQIPTFIQSLVKQFNLSITAQATGMLQAYLGNDLTRIENELQKLRLNLAAEGEITEAAIEHYIGLQRPFNIFELQKAIMQKDYPKSYQIIKGCKLETKEQVALPIVGLLYNCFSKLLMLYQTEERAPAKVAQHIEVHPYFVGAYLHALKHYSLAETLQNITFLHQADLQLKGVGCNTHDDQIMKELIFKLMHP